MKRKPMSSMNVIPFIDIMLVLLVMVLTTATFIRQGIIPVDLPEAKSAEKKSNDKEVTIYVTKKGEIFFEKERVELSELRSKLQELSKTDIVVLRSDKESKFQDFVHVMDVLKKLNHESLYIVTAE
jgi:biopolymer transport protein ExbD